VRVASFTLLPAVHDGVMSTRVERGASEVNPIDLRAACDRNDSITAPGE
jgi:hypothetical protein